MAPTENGAYTAGSGAFGDADEAVLNDGDFTALAANGDAETYTQEAMTLPSGTLQAVIVTGRVRNSAGGAQSAKAPVRIGSTDYDQASNYAGIGIAYTGSRACWAQDPSTSATWTQADASSTSLQFGFLEQT